MCVRALPDVYATDARVPACVRTCARARACVCGGGVYARLWLLYLCFDSAVE